MGRSKEKQYQYSEDLKFIREFDSLADVCKVFGLSKGNFYSGNEYRQMTDGTFISNYRIGRERLRKLIRIANCKFCTRHHEKSRKIAAYNLRGEKIAEFKNLTIAENLTGISRGTIKSSCLYGGTSKSKTNLHFKYVEKKQNR